MFSNYQRNLGFTLLEAMIAIVVVTMGLFATYSWVNVNIQSLVRAEQVVEQEILIEELIEELLVTDLSRIDSGQTETGAQSLRWTAEPIERRSGVNSIGIVGLYDHTLYEVRVAIYSDNIQVGEYSTRLVDSKQVRQPKLPL